MTTFDASRDTLFGDMPLEECENLGAGAEPWLSFQRARACLARDDNNGACDTLAAITFMQGVASRYRLLAWHALRELGRAPPDDVGQQILGVVVDVGMDGGLDLLAAYADRTVHYYNYAGSGVVWIHPDSSLDGFIDTVLQTARTVLPRVGPWSAPRRPSPPTGHVRLNILTPVGLYFGEGPFDLLDSDPLAGPLLQAATSLMRKLTSLPRSRAVPPRLDS
jgi:hypothetical protein